MSLQELKQARNLSVSDRLELARAIIESLQNIQRQQSSVRQLLEQLESVGETLDR